MFENSTRSREDISLLEPLLLRAGVMQMTCGGLAYRLWRGNDVLSATGLYQDGVDLICCEHEFFEQRLGYRLDRRT